MPRLLLLLGQSPFDPTSGAAQSTRLLAELAAREGFTVEALATTGCEGPIDSEAFHRDLVTQGQPLSPPGLWLHFRTRGVTYRLLRVDPQRKHQWELDQGDVYERAFANCLQPGNRPDLVLTYGADTNDQIRRERLRASGSTIIFAVHNHAYRRSPPSKVDHFLFPTEYLKNHYGSDFSARASVLPVPLDPLSEKRDPERQHLLTFINPEPAKGAMLVAQLIDKLRCSQPEQPILVVGGRAPAEAILQVGHDLGLDLSLHPELYLLPPRQDVCEIWAETQLLLMPSAAPEAAGRCALEAMLAGAIPLVSNRGGLPEVVGTAGYVLPAPPPLSGRPRPVPKRTLTAWHMAICHLKTHPAERLKRAQACQQAAERHLPANTSAAFADWLREIR